MAGFRDMIYVCGLCDLGFKGVPWTIEKKVKEGNFLSHSSGSSSRHSFVVL
jgi:hypothetical protein